MKKYSLLILRIGLGITFLWIGIMIFKNPEAWGSYIQPWAVKLLPIPIKEMMLGTALLDMVIGVLLLLNILTPWMALLGGMHLVTVLITSGINEGTVRDIAILASSATLFNETITETALQKIMFWRKH